MRQVDCQRAVALPEGKFIAIRLCLIGELSFKIGSAGDEQNRKSNNFNIQKGHAFPLYIGALNGSEDTNDGFAKTGACCSLSATNAMCRLFKREERLNSLTKSVSFRGLRKKQGFHSFAALGLAVQACQPAWLAVSATPSTSCLLCCILLQKTAFVIIFRGFSRGRNRARTN